MCAKGTDGKPIASPHISHVLAYDRAIRTLTASTMNAGHDFRLALENALADDETRRLNFDIPFTHDSSSRMCTSLTAPGLSEIHPHLAVEGRGQKRPALALLDRADPPPAPVGKRAKARRSAVQKKNSEIEALKKQLANRGNGGGGGGRDRGNGGGKGSGKGSGKGAGKGGAPQAQGAGLAGRLGLPPGAKLKSGDDRMICSKYNKGQCNMADCKFAHICYFCEGTDHTGQNCTQSR